MSDIVILGVFVADTTYRAERQPRIGETILGQSFSLGPGGKGSNQSVACGRLGAEVTFLSKLGKDAFADMAFRMWETEGVTARVTQDPDTYTGAAYIFVDASTGDNAIIIAPGAGGTISTADIEAEADLIRGARVFMTQLEQPMDAAVRALEIAREAGVTTILNPAPAAELPEGTLRLCDYVTPNEPEAEALTGLRVDSEAEAGRAAQRLVELGAGAAVITLGERGVLYHGDGAIEVVPALNAGAVVETTGAGDAFNGGFATALARGDAPLDAVRYGCATAAISVTRPGTAPSMPTREEVEMLLARSG
jgi:ribokinase